MGVDGAEVRRPVGRAHRLGQFENIRRILDLRLRLLLHHRSKRCSITGAGGASKIGSGSGAGGGRGGAIIGRGGGSGAGAICAGGGAFGISSSAMMRRMEARISSIDGS